MNACDFCFESTRNRRRDSRGNLLCTPCRESLAYHESLTPAERQDEDRMIAAYTAEAEEWG